MFVGIGVGVHRQRFAGSFATSYSSRVIADGGTIEALDCVAAASSLLQSASLLIIPSGYKAGVAYAELPADGNGDLTWSRNSVANRTQSDGNIGSVAANVPRLSYMYGSCPALLLEPQRTNLILWSEQFDDAYWSKYLATVNANTATSPDGSTNADLVYPSSTGSLSGQLYRQISTGISSGNVVTVSAFVKASGKNFAYLSEIQNSFTPAAYFNLTTGAITNISAGVTASMTSFSNGWWRISITSTAGAGSYWAVIGSTDSAGSTINTVSGTNGILVYGYQVEVGAYPTTYIPTTNATATRLADTFTRNNIYTNGLISASGGTLFIEMLNNIEYTRDAAAQGIGIGDSSTTIANGFLIVNTGTGRQVIQKIIASATTNLFTTTTDTIKIAIKWNGTSADVFVNGTKQVSATAFTTTLMEFLNGTGAGIPRWIKTMALYPTPLSDSDCTTLTT